MDTLRTLREAQGLTQAEVADRAGIAQTYLSMLERSHRDNPSLDVVAALAAALGLPVQTVVEAIRRAQGGDT